MRPRARLLAVLLALVATAAGAGPAAGQARARWDTRVLALVPRPGFPAHAYVHPNGRVYVGTYDNPAGDTVPSRVFEYTGAGALLRSWTVRGQDLSGPHGVQAATSNGDGHLVLLDKSPPRALLLNRNTGEQLTYSTFPAGTIPNYAAWGPDGSLYVTDYGNPTLWRVPPRGGPAQAWLTDARLDGDDFGTTGLALQADRRTLLLAQQSEAGGGAGNPSTGRLFTIPIQGDGRPGPPRQLWESGPFEGPDGFGIAESGAIYIALLATNQIAVVGPDGRDRERFPRQPGSGANGSSVPFDAPSSARFLGTRLMVANQSYFTGDPTRQAVLDVEVGERGLPELVPPRTETAAERAERRRRARCRARDRRRARQRRRSTRRRATCRRPARTRTRSPRSRRR